MVPDWESTCITRKNCRTIIIGKRGRVIDPKITLAKKKGIHVICASEKIGIAGR